MIFKIDWSAWLGLLGVLGIVLAGIKILARIYFVGRDEFEKLEEIIGKLSYSVHDTSRKTKILTEERKSFREEVLDRIDALSLRIDEVVNK